jgi:hypothetical protein
MRNLVTRPTARGPQAATLLLATVLGLSAPVFASGAPASPAAGPPICAPKEEPVFRCPTKAGAVMMICVDVKARHVRLVKDEAGKRTVIADGLPAQRVTTGRIWGTTLQWPGRSGPWTLFLRADEPLAILTQGPDTSVVRERCKDNIYDVLDGAERAQPSGYAVSVLTLPQFGLSHPMPQAPNPPE